MRLLVLMARIYRFDELNMGAAVSSPFYFRKIFEYHTIYGRISLTRVVGNKES